MRGLWAGTALRSCLSKKTAGSLSTSTGGNLRTCAPESLCSSRHILNALRKLTTYSLVDFLKDLKHTLQNMAPWVTLRACHAPPPPPPSPTRRLLAGLEEASGNSSLTCTQSGRGEQTLACVLYLQLDTDHVNS